MRFVFEPALLLLSGLDGTDDMFCLVVVFGDDVALRPETNWLGACRFSHPALARRVVLLSYPLMTSTMFVDKATKRCMS